MRQYSEVEAKKKTGAQYRHLISIPRSIASILKGTLRGTLPSESVLFMQIVKRFNDSKFSDRFATKHEDLSVTGIEYVISPTSYINFMHSIARRDAKKRQIMIVFHGTTSNARESIILNNFSMKKIGSSTRNMGWFGCGIYFARRAYTALGYNEGEHLLASIVVFESCFTCPLPDSSENPYHGKPCKDGYDAHYSPTKKELVIFSPKQVLPCFKVKRAMPFSLFILQLTLSHSDYKSRGRSEYQGSEIDKPETVDVEDSYDVDGDIIFKMFGPRS
jgi:hypothetical protein